MISDKDIALVKGMLERGDRQSDIAAWFGVNSGRIAEVSTGQRGDRVKAARPEQLPPTGPYAVVPKRFVEDFERLARELHTREIGETDEAGKVRRRQVGARRREEGRRDQEDTRPRRRHAGLRAAGQRP